MQVILFGLCCGVVKGGKKRGFKKRGKDLTRQVTFCRDSPIEGLNGESERKEGKTKKGGSFLFQKVKFAKDFQALAGSKERRKKWGVES